MNSTPTAVPRSVTVRRRKTVARVLAGRVLGRVRWLVAGYFSMDDVDVVPLLVLSTLGGLGVWGPAAMAIFGRPGMPLWMMCLVGAAGTFASPLVVVGPWFANQFLVKLSHWWAGVLAEVDND